MTLCGLATFCRSFYYDGFWLVDTDWISLDRCSFFNRWNSFRKHFLILACSVQFFCLLAAFLALLSLVSSSFHQKTDFLCFWVVLETFNAVETFVIKVSQIKSKLIAWSTSRQNLLTYFLAFFQFVNLILTSSLSALLSIQCDRTFKIHG